MIGDPTLIGILQGDRFRADITFSDRQAIDFDNRN